MIEIMNRWTRAALYQAADAQTIADAVQAACASGADLSDADLRDANLRGAYLSDANLGGADLSDADLRDANLGGADLRGAYLSGANLGGAYLSGANLRGADLSGADLRDANLRDANLRGAKISWSSHAMLSEILWRAADSEPRQMLAAYVGQRLDWCWRQWLVWQHPEKGWALDVLACWVREGDGAPDELHELAAAQREAAAEPVGESA
jgi:hypothetical protein